MSEDDDPVEVIAGIVRDACRDTGYTPEEAARDILSYLQEGRTPSSTDPVEE